MSNDFTVQKPRDLSFDTIKGIMIFLVVFGHAITQRFFYNEDYSIFTSHNIFLLIKSLIYTTHMPVMVFVSGYFSKNITGKSFDYFKKVVVNYLLPYLIVNSAIVIFDKKGLIDLLYPQYTLWYLLSLFYWKILIKIIPRNRMYIVFSIVLSLACGFTSFDKYLSISRTIAFLPFYLFGFYMSDSQVERVRRTKKTLGMTTIIAVLFFSYLIWCQDISPGFYEIANSYYDGGHSLSICFMLRLIALVFGFLMILSVINVIDTKKETRFSVVGRNSIVIYLLHGRVLVLLKRLVKTILIFSEVGTILVAIIITIIIIKILSLPFFINTYKKMIKTFENMSINDKSAT